MKIVSLVTRSPEHVKSRGWRSQAPPRTAYWHLSSVFQRLMLRRQREQQSSQACSLLKTHSSRLLIPSLSSGLSDSINLVMTLAVTIWSPHPSLKLHRHDVFKSSIYGKLSPTSQDFTPTLFSAFISSCHSFCVIADETPGCSNELDRSKTHLAWFCRK